MEVETLPAPHVVWLTGIDHEIGLSSVLNAGGNERQTVLGYYGGIIIAGDNLQLSLEVGSLVDERCLFVAFGIVLGGIHIAFPIHYFVPFPVDDRTTSHTHLEDIVVVGHQRNGHETAKRPAMNTDALFIDIGQRLKVFDSFHLVLHFNLSKLAESSLLEIPAAVFRASVVDDEHQIAFRGHIRLPATTHIMPGGIDTMGMRTSIDIDDGRVFLLGIEVDRLDNAIVEVGLAVGSLQRSTFKGRLFIVCPWVVSREENLCTLFLTFQIVRIGDLNDTWNRGLLIAVDKIAAAV